MTGPRSGRPAPAGGLPVTGIVAAILAALILASCAVSPAPGTPAQGAASPPGGSSPTPPDGPPPAPSAGSAGVGPVDPASAGLARRIQAPGFGPDVTAAVVEALARSGIATLPRPGGSDERPPADPLSPIRLLEWQARNLAAGAQASNGPSGAELDTLQPIPPELADRIPPVSAILAAYVAAADTPGAALSRALLAGDDLTDAATVRFPTLVLVLFASDLATDAPATAAGEPRVAGEPATAAGEPATAAGGPAMAIAAAFRPAQPGSAVEDAGGICSQAQAFVTGVIHDLFAALHAATPDNLPGRILVSIWNWLVSQAEAVVQHLVQAVTDEVKRVIADIASIIGSTAQVVAAFLPYAVHVAADPGRLELPIDPAAAIDGRVNVAVSVGDIPPWPDWMADCAAVSGAPLPDLKVAGSTVDLAIRYGAGYIVQPAASGRLGQDGTLSLPFQSVVEPADRKGGSSGEATVRLEASVERQELAQLRQTIGDRLFGQIPEILRGFVSALFRPYVDSLLRRIDRLLDARGAGSLEVIFHLPPSPTPEPTPAPPATPPPSAAAAVPLPDACALMTAADVSQLVGQPIQAVPDTDAVIDPATQSACSYIVGDGTNGALKLFVNDPGALDGLIARVPAQPVAGLGDRAYAWDIGSVHTLAVAVGPVVIQAQLSTRFYPAGVTDAMARVAVSRLGR